MSPDTIAALIIIGGAVVMTIACVVSEAKKARRVRDALLLAFLRSPLPALNAPDKAFDDYGRAVIGLRAHPFAETARQIAALETTEDVA
jgi:hypothetical protein